MGNLRTGNKRHNRAIARQATKPAPVASAKPKKAAKAAE
jgi:hypothetical protein